MGKKFKKIISITIIVLILICFFTSLTITTAEETKPTDNYTLLVGLPGMDDGEAIKLGPYLENIFKIGIGIAGILAVIMIIIGGVMYMTVESIESKSSAKSKINNAIFGLILALSSYLLLNTINPAFIKGDLSLKPVPAPDPIDIPPSQTIYKGVCKAGDSSNQCIGGSLAECMTDCRAKCPTKITYTQICYQIHNSTKWIGKCNTGQHKDEVCGEGTTSKKTCQTACETNSSCVKSPISYPTPCQKQ